MKAEKLGKSVSHCFFWCIVVTPHFTNLLINQLICNTVTLKTLAAWDQTLWVVSRDDSLLYTSMEQS